MTFNISLDLKDEHKVKLFCHQQVLDILCVCMDLCIHGPS